MRSRQTWLRPAILASAILIVKTLAPTAALIAAGASTDHPDKAEAGRAAPTNNLFGLTKVYHLQLELSAKDWEAMQNVDQVGGPGFFGGPGRPEKPPKQPPRAESDVHRTGFIEFPWVHASLKDEGRTYQNVGLRYKGNFTYMISRRQLKRSLKVEFDHYDKNAPRFHGLKKFNLHAGVMDSTKVHEALSYAFFRAAGVAAPRTAFAEVTLSVPGLFDCEYVGLFILTEQVDKQFLKECFGNNKGLLMKPLLRGPDFLGETWDKYRDFYRPHREPSAAEIRRIIEFARLVNSAEDEPFRRQINSYLDVEAFLRFIAVNALIVNLDSPFAMAQNYYVYLHPETGKFVFFPWDLDLSMASWPLGGPPEQQMKLSLLHPHFGEHKLIDRLLAMPEVKEHYLKLLKEMAATCFSKEQLLQEIDAIEQTTQAPLAREAKAVAARQEGGRGFGFGPPGGGMQGPDPRTFVEKRTESVQAQLAGKTNGYVPTGGFGMPGGPWHFSPPGGGPPRAEPADQMRPR